MTGKAGAAEMVVRVPDQPTPDVIGKSYLVVYTYQLGVPKFGLPAGTLVERGEWVCDCRGGIDPNCGGPGCWGITAEAAARFAAAETSAWRRPLGLRPDVADHECAPAPAPESAP